MQGRHQQLHSLLGLEPDRLGVRALAHGDDRFERVFVDRGGADSHLVGEGPDVLRGQLGGDGVGDLRRGRASPLAGHDHHQDPAVAGQEFAGGLGILDLRLGAVDADVGDVRVRRQRVEDVGAFGPGDRQRLDGQDPPAAQVAVRLHHGGRTGLRVRRDDGFPHQAEVGDDVVEVGALGGGQHDGAHCVDQALAHQDLAVGARLLDLHQRLGLVDHGVEGQAGGREARLQVGQPFGPDALVAEQHGKRRRGQARKVDVVVALHGGAMSPPAREGGEPGPLSGLGGQQGRLPPITPRGAPAAGP